MVDSQNIEKSVTPLCSEEERSALVDKIVVDADVFASAVTVHCNLNEPTQTCISVVSAEHGYCCSSVYERREVSLTQEF